LRMASVAATNKMEQKCLVGARIMFSQSLMVTDGTFKFDYATVTFVNPVMLEFKLMKHLDSLNAGIGATCRMQYLW